MAKRIVTKIGDVFSAKLPDGTKGHFQFVAIDKANMSSTVIRVFKKRYALNETPSIDEIVHGEVAFYAHTILRVGIEDGAWEKIGMIFNYKNILDRLERGYYPVGYPEYEVLKRKPWPDYNSYTKRELEIGTVYFHFLGEKLMREVVVADGKGKRFSANDKKRSLFGLKTAKAFPCDIEFSDINWTHYNFITEEDFNNVWDGCRK